MSLAGTLLFSAPRAHYGGEQKTVDVLRRLDGRGLQYERIGRLVWRKFESDWYFAKLMPEGGWTRDDRIAGVDLRAAKRLTDRHYGRGDYGL